MTNPCVCKCVDQAGGVQVHLPRAPFSPFTSWMRHVAKKHLTVEI